MKNPTILRTWLLVAALAGCASNPEDPAAGTAGSFGFAGTDGTAGTGLAGTDGSAGTTGTAGTGVAGTLGAAGTDVGTAGTAGTAGTGGTAGTDGTAGTGAAGTGVVSGEFPRATPVSVALKGPYTYKTYEMTDPDWAAATMYYPENAPEPFAVMALSPGFTETKEHMKWWGEVLASHGFAVLNTSPLDTFGDQPPARGKDLETAVARIIAENALDGSPLKGKLATDRIGLSGHSMGGGGSLYAAAALKNKVRAVIPLMEHGPYITSQAIGSITAALFFIAGENDGEPLGPPTKYSIPHFMQATSSIPRVVGVIAGGDHFLGVAGGAYHAEQARYALAWLKMHLEDDMRYETYFYGADHTPELWSTYTCAPDPCN